MIVTRFAFLEGYNYRKYKQKSGFRPFCLGTFCIKCDSLRLCVVIVESIIFLLSFLFLMSYVGTGHSSQPG